jgi:hypothetical protein
MVVRVSIMRCDAAQFATLSSMMADAEQVLAPGIRSMRGFRLFFAGADESSLSLTNVSHWDTLEDAKQMDVFQPMLDLGKQFVAAGARFERPIMNYEPLWQLGPDGF